jgi:Thioredoxin-like
VHLFGCFFGYTLLAATLPTACRRFTPILKGIYEKLRSNPGEDFEIVYCSLDNFRNEYDNYTSDMPWWCLPLKSPVVDRLRTFYKTEGIPHLVILSKEGTLLCGDAVNDAMEDPTGARFPWRCPNSIEEVLPDTFVQNDGTTYLETTTLDDKYLILYFGALWCPRCTTLTKKVVRAYRALKRTRDDVEVSLMCCRFVIGAGVQHLLISTIR